jgi:hypothetical protein
MPHRWSNERQIQNCGHLAQQVVSRHACLQIDVVGEKSRLPVARLCSHHMRGLIRADGNYSNSLENLLSWATRPYVGCYNPAFLESVVCRVASWIKDTQGV